MWDLSSRDDIHVAHDNVVTVTMIVDNVANANASTS